MYLSSARTLVLLNLQSGHDFINLSLLSDLFLLLVSQESAVETLADVLQEYLIKVCKLLRAAVDREALTGSTGFQVSKQ